MSNELQNVLNEIKLEKDTNLLPENIKKDVKIFDITGTLEQGGTSKDVPVKLFKTQEEMQADTTAKEGDLAVVYRSEVQNMTADMEVTAITFPETVTLPAAFTDSANGSLRAVDSSVMFDGYCDLNKTSFRFDGWSESGMIRVEYTSTDGITYTRTSFQGDNGDLTNPVEVPACKVERQEEWNDNLGYFMQIGGNIFDGLFEYRINTIDDKSIRAAIINDSQIGEDIPATSTTNITYNYTTIEIDISVLNNMLSKFYNQYAPKYEYDIIYDVVTGNFKFYYSTAGGVYLAYYPSVSKWYLLVTDKNETMHCIEYSVTNDTFNEIELHSVDNKNLVGDTGDYPCYSTDNLAIIATASSYNNTNSLTRKMVEMRMVTDISYRTFNSSPDYDNLVNKYKCAPTQLTLSNPNEILPGKVGYGKNGVVTADGSIYNNLDITKVLTDIHKLPESTIDSYKVYGPIDNTGINSTDIGKLMLIKNTDTYTGKGIITVDTNLRDSIRNLIDTDTYTVSKIIINKSYSYAVVFYYTDSSNVILGIVDVNNMSLISSIPTNYHYMTEYNAGFIKDKYLIFSPRQSQQYCQGVYYIDVTSSSPSIIELSTSGGFTYQYHGSFQIFSEDIAVLYMYTTGGQETTNIPIEIFTVNENDEFIKLNYTLPECKSTFVNTIFEINNAYYLIATGYESDGNTSHWVFLKIENGIVSKLSDAKMTAITNITYPRCK